MELKKAGVTLVVGGFFVSIALLGWNIYHSKKVLSTTGILTVSINNTEAPLVISGPGTRAEIIGRGSASIRIAPGSYLVSSNYNGRTANTVVSVKLKQTTEKKLTLGDAYSVPSYKNVTYTNLDDILLANSATTAQVELLKQLLFEYRPSAQKIIFDKASAALGPYDGDNPSTIIYVNASVDGTTVKATISYSGLTDMSLQLRDPNTNALLFDSTPKPEE